jgi:putative Mn2+ efflux pump MntP
MTTTKQKSSGDMRVEVAIVVLALAIGLAVALLLSLFGLAPPAFGLAIGLTVGVVLAACLLMGYYAMDSVRELVKQIAVWLGIVVLLPLAVWFGTSIFSQPPDWRQYHKSTSRLDEKIQQAAGEAEKEKLYQQKDRLEKELEEAERVYYGAMFWVAYPVGLVSLVLGLIFPVQAVGAGLMFGGLASLAAGCYSYWDRMEGWLRFGSLVVALIVLLVLGTWRFRPVRPSSQTAA